MIEITEGLQAGEHNSGDGDAFSAPGFTGQIFKNRLNYLIFSIFYCF